MGVDFVRKIARSFHKGLDRRRIELATPTLFARPVTAAPRRYAVSLQDRQVVCGDEQLGVHLAGDRVVMLRGLLQVGVFERPSAALLDALAESHGEACAIVREVHDLARTAEVELC